MQQLGVMLRHSREKKTFSKQLFLLMSWIHTQKLSGWSCSAVAFDFCIRVLLGWDHLSNRAAQLAPKGRQDLTCCMGIYGEIRALLGVLPLMLSHLSCSRGGWGERENLSHSDSSSDLQELGEATTQGI